MSDKQNEAGDGELSSIPFEQALKELEGIVGKLEQGSVDLEESIVIYERGEKLKVHCETLLSNAEMKIEAIRAGRDGQGENVEPLALD